MNRIWLQSYPPGVPPEVDLKRLSSLAELVEHACTAYRELPAYEQFGATLSYGQLDELSRAFAAWLQSVGLAKGDRIAIMLPNCLQYPVALFGALRAGLVVVNTNPLYTARELAHQLEDSGALAIVVLENFAHVVEEVAPHSQLKHILVTAVGDLLPAPKSWLVNFVVRHRRKQVSPWHIPQAVTLPSVLRAGRGLRFRPELLGSDDLAFLQYTGGTTGVAKGAMLTHGNLCANLLQALSWIDGYFSGEPGTLITAIP
ncbi:MAG: AMP-binding protein, partial [Pseudomonadota bacterium]|nr:AMP-binding protein [Pseudomonadota bacterium]